MEPMNIDNPRDYTLEELKAEAQRLMDILAQFPKRRTRKWTDVDRERAKTERQLSSVRYWIRVGRYKKEGE